MAYILFVHWQIRLSIHSVHLSLFRNIIITTTSILVVATLKTPPTTSILVAGSQRVKIKATDNGVTASVSSNNCNFTLIKQRYAGGVFCVMAAQCLVLLTRGPVSDTRMFSRSISAYSEQWWRTISRSRGTSARGRMAFQANKSMNSQFYILFFHISFIAKILVHAHRNIFCMTSFAFLRTFQALRYRFEPFWVLEKLRIKLWHFNNVSIVKVFFIILPS